MDAAVFNVLDSTVQKLKTASIRIRDQLISLSIMYGIIETQNIEIEILLGKGVLEV